MALATVEKAGRWSGSGLRVRRIQQMFFGSESVSNHYLSDKACWTLELLLGTIVVLSVTSTATLLLAVVPAATILGYSALVCMVILALVLAYFIWSAPTRSEHHEFQSTLTNAREEIRTAHERLRSSVDRGREQLESEFTALRDQLKSSEHKLSIDRARLTKEASDLSRSREDERRLHLPWLFEWRASPPSVEHLGAWCLSFWQSRGFALISADGLGPILRLEGRISIMSPGHSCPATIKIAFQLMPGRTGAVVHVLFEEYWSDAGLALTAVESLCEDFRNHMDSWLSGKTR